MFDGARYIVESFNDTPIIGIDTGVVMGKMEVRKNGRLRSVGQDRLAGDRGIYIEGLL